MRPDWAIDSTLGKFFKPLATIIQPKSRTFLGNFWKSDKIYHFLWNHYWATFIDIWQIFSGHTGRYLPTGGRTKTDFSIKGRKCKSLNLILTPTWHCDLRPIPKKSLKMMPDNWNCYQLSRSAFFDCEKRIPNKTHPTTTAKYVPPQPLYPQTPSTPQTPHHHPWNYSGLIFTINPPCSLPPFCSDKIMENLFKCRKS